MARGYVRTIRDLEELYYGSGAGYIQKSNADMLSTTAGVYNPIYGKLTSCAAIFSNVYGKTRLVSGKALEGNSEGRLNNSPVETERRAPLIVGDATVRAAHINESAEHDRNVHAPFRNEWSNKTGQSLEPT